MRRSVRAWATRRSADASPFMGSENGTIPSDATDPAVDSLPNMPSLEESNDLERCVVLWVPAAGPPGYHLRSAHSERRHSKREVIGQTNDSGTFDERPGERSDRRKRETSQKPKV